MSDQTKDGGPAFPFSMHPEHGYGPAESVDQGMSLRDWFAGQAMKAVVSNPHRDKNTAEDQAAKFAQCAYKLADAMLAEREKRNVAI